MSKKGVGTGKVTFPRETIWGVGESFKLMQTIVDVGSDYFNIILLSTSIYTR